MRMIIIFVTIDITEMIIVVVRAHDFPFNKPYEMRMKPTFIIKLGGRRGVTLW